MNKIPTSIKTNPDSMQTLKSIVDFISQFNETLNPGDQCQDDLTNIRKELHSYAGEVLPTQDPANSWEELYHNYSWEELYSYKFIIFPLTLTITTTCSPQNIEQLFKLWLDSKPERQVNFDEFLQRLGFAAITSHHENIPILNY